MTGDESTWDPGSCCIPPVGTPMTNNQKPADRKKTGSEWIGILYMGVGLFVLIAAFQLYFIIQDLIRTWVSDQFVPLFTALYYIIIILTGVWLLRECVRHN